MTPTGTSAIHVIRRLYALFSAEEKKQFAIVVCFTFLGSVFDLAGLSLVIPIAGLVLSDEFYNRITHIIPAFSDVPKNELLLYSLLCFFVIIVLKNLFVLYVNQVQLKFISRFYLRSGLKMLDRIFAKPLLTIRKKSSDVWAHKASHLQAALCSNIVLPSITIINELFILAFVMVSMAIWEWKLFVLLLAVPLPLLGVTYARLKKSIKDAGKERNAESVALNQAAREMMLGYEDIKIANTVDSFKQHFAALLKRNSQPQWKMVFLMLIPTRLIEVIIFLCVILILLYGVYVLQDVEQIVTTVSMFLVVSYRVLPTANRLIQAMNSINAVEFVLEDPDFITVDEQSTTPASFNDVVFNNSIVFEDISFQYPDTEKKILDNCNLKIRKGERIGIVGTSGVGKSTLINNLLGFLHPTSGSIHIDNIPLNEITAPGWQKHLGYVRQNVFIMNKTLAENIAAGTGADKLDIERLNQVINLAGLERLVSEWPEGIHTVLRENGSNISDGQKQRIAIARALYKNAEVLIFDEATAALDHQTEREVTEAITNLGHDITVIIIAHRHKPLTICDKIYKLEHGKLSSPYTYEEFIHITTSHL